MTIAKKLLVVLLILGAGLGTALLFQKSPDALDDTDASAQASSLEAAITFVASGHPSLRHSPDETSRHASGNLYSRRDELANVTNLKPVLDGALDSAGVRPNGDLRGTRRRPVVRELDESAQTPNMANVLANETKLANMPELPNRFPKSGGVGNHLRPVYATVDLRDRPVPSGDTAAKIVPETHRVVDGDTLETLAIRYFGDARRAIEIYELNRDRIDNPVLLPIGIDLRLHP